MPLLLAWTAGRAEAFPYVSRTGDICVQVQTSFTDLAGDSWIQNGDRSARGFAVTVTDRSGTRSRQAWLTTGSSACLFGYTVEVTSADPTFSVVVDSRARVNGVDLESWQGYHPSARQFLQAAFTVTASASPFTADLVVTGSDQRWRNLLVATMVFRNYDWNVTEGNTIGCCLPTEAGFQPDASCPAPGGGDGYAVIAAPIQLQAWPSTPDPSGTWLSNKSAAQCCGSVLANDGSPGLETGTNVPYKFAIAHEIGHVIAGMRMGAREEGQNYFADEGSCRGDMTLGVPLDPGKTRGEFTKEFFASALREGWGNFVAAVTWNSRSEADCDFQVGFGSRSYDFDLSGTDDFSVAYAASADRTRNGVQVPGSALIGTWDCSGVPQVDGMSPAAPGMPGWLGPVNWLAEVEAQGECDTTTADEEDNRSTVADVTSLFWALTTDQGVGPAALSDLYVDTCPREWASESDGDDGVGDDRPTIRMGLSASHNGLYGEVAAEWAHVAQ